ncbi:aldehyde dehydrogenase [Dentipellis sp. KUC8613]|nr:aldehyde dehydrogenase [Dentipellis sp. KUC8613]
MTTSWTHEFDTPAFKGKVSFPTGVFIDGKFSQGSTGKTIDVINSTNGKVITSIAEGTAEDVDRAVKAAKKAFETTWGLNAPGELRGKLLNKLADLLEEHADEFAAIEAVDGGKAFTWARMIDVNATITTFRYYAGWAGKNSGKTIETNEGKLAYTRHEPIGVCGQIIPWNFPRERLCLSGTLLLTLTIFSVLMASWKLGPALSTGNTVILKPSELTPLSALRLCSLIKEAGFPDGVVNVVVGYGKTVGEALSSHMEIDKIAFTGSTIVGRRIMESAAKSNLKKVTLELGGKNPAIVFDDADLDKAVGWSVHGLLWNQGQVCSAASRFYVQAGIYDKYISALSARIAALKVGDPFDVDTYQGPQISEIHADKIMGYIKSGQEQGANVLMGGERHQHAEDGYFVQPTIFTDVTPEMKIAQEEIFGPVGVFSKFTDEADVVRQANDTPYGLTASVFSQDINRALNAAHKLQAGTVFVNSANNMDMSVPFGGYKQSGIGRELGEYALANYTNVKAVHVNLGLQM